MVKDPEGRIEKVKKLLQLAEDAGATTAEAMNAMAKAQDLMAKYHLAMAQVVGWQEDEGVVDKEMRHNEKQDIEYFLGYILRPGKLDGRENIEKKTQPAYYIGKP